MNNEFWPIYYIYGFKVFYKLTKKPHHVTEKQVR